MRLSILAVTLSALSTMILGAPSTSENLNVLEKRYSGKLTHYTPGLGACGATHSSSSYVAALSADIWANGAHCFKTLVIHANGKTTTAMIADKCPSCNSGHLDLSPQVFQYFAPPSVSVINGASWDIY